MAQLILQVASGFLRGEQKLFTAGTGEEEDLDSMVPMALNTCTRLQVCS